MAETRLQALGQRYTTARRALVDVLADANVPLMIGEISGRAEGLTVSSTYRNLAVMQQAGFVRRIVGSGEHASFELAEEMTGHHHHLICTDCGSIRDFTISDELEDEIEKALRRVAKRHDFGASEHRLDLVGVCGACS